MILCIEKNFSSWHEDTSLEAGKLFDPPVVISTACYKSLLTGGYFFNSRGHSFFTHKNQEKV